MTVFRLIAGLSIAALFLGMAYDLHRQLKGWKAVGGFLRHQMRNSRHGGRRERALRFDNARRIATIISSGLFLILAMTGFPPVLFLGSHLTGVLLVIHVTSAPLFALSLSALALLWAHRLRFNGVDWHTVQAFGKRRSPGKDALVTLALKAGFWIILLLSLPLMLTVILGLFPLFGTEGEALLIRLHGYSALLLMVAALSELYLIIAYGEHTTEYPSKEQNT